MTKMQLTYIKTIALAGLFIAGTAYAACPADVSTLAPGTWCAVSNSNMRSVGFNWPAGTDYSKNGLGVDAVISTWSGGAYDTKRDRLIVWGGGHFAYGGNEIYAFDVNALKWMRISDPSIPVAENTAHASDGGPVSRHSYDSIEYVSSIDRFCAFGIAGNYSTGVELGASTDCFNFDTLSWERKADATSYGIGAISDVDPVTGRVWVRGNNGYKGTFSEWDPVKNSWSLRIAQETDNTMYYKTGAIDPKRRKFVGVGGGDVYVWDIGTSGTIVRQNITTSGASEIVNSKNAGFAYDSVSDRLVAWDSGANVYALNTDTWVWSLMTPASSNMGINMATTMIPITPPTINITNGSINTPTREAKVSTLFS